MIKKTKKKRNLEPERFSRRKKSLTSENSKKYQWRIFSSWNEFIFIGENVSIFQK